MKLSLKTQHKKILISLTIFLLVAFMGCSVLKKRPATRKNALKKIHSYKYPDFNDDISFDGLENSINMSLSYLEKISSEKKFHFGKDTYKTPHMIKSLLYFKYFLQTNPSVKEAKSFIKANYFIYKSVGNKEKKVMFTGYYEPFLTGSITKNNINKYPIYAKPGNHIVIDLSLFSSEFKGKKIIGRINNNSVVPYYERRDISNEEIFKDTATPLAWVNDPIDLFFLQIQGSGKILMDNGDILNVHYATTNGHPYRSIGKLLIDKNKIPRSEMSMQRIRTYLKQHPEEVSEIFNYNPSYVFFKLEEDGPYGCLNVKLTPGRSLATDRRIFPSAGLVFINTQKPVVNGDGNIEKWIDFGRFVLNQDTGGAIRGPGRGDLFCGNGDYAELTAGHMQHYGDMYFLILKSDI